jgi:hypothetical protein
VSCWAYLGCHVTFAEDTAKEPHINVIIIYTTMAMYSPITICQTPLLWFDFTMCEPFLKTRSCSPDINTTVLYQLLVCFPEFLVIIIWLALWTFPLLLWTSYDFSVASMMLLLLSHDVCSFPDFWQMLLVISQGFFVLSTVLLGFSINSVML